MTQLRSRNPASKHVPTGPNRGRQFSVSPLKSEEKPAHLTLPHTDKLIKALSTTPASEPGMSTPPSDPPRSQPAQRPPEEPVDPAKSYLTRLPSELKLEIIDHIYGHPAGFVKDPTAVAFSKSERSTLVDLRLSVRLLTSVVIH